MESVRLRCGEAWSDWAPACMSACVRTLYTCLCIPSLSLSSSLFSLHFSDFSVSLLSLDRFPPLKIEKISRHLLRHLAPPDFFAFWLLSSLLRSFSPLQNRKTSRHFDTRDTGAIRPRDHLNDRWRRNEEGTTVTRSHTRCYPSALALHVSRTASRWSIELLRVTQVFTTYRRGRRQG